MLRGPMNSPEPQPSPETSFDADQLIVIVVGAHPRAEQNDRPLAYRLREQILSWLDARPGDELEFRRQPLVLSDLWYLNDQSLHLAPVVAIGEPEVNAVTARLATHLPTAFIIEQSFRVQLDPEYIDLKACIWGDRPSSTGGGVDLFTERYLDAFLRSAHDLPIDA